MSNCSDLNHYMSTTLAKQSMIAKKLMWSCKNNSVHVSIVDKHVPRLMQHDMWLALNSIQPSTLVCPLGAVHQQCHQQPFYWCFCIFGCQGFKWLHAAPRTSAECLQHISCTPCQIQGCQSGLCQLQCHSTLPKRLLLLSITKSPSPKVHHQNQIPK